MKQERTIKMIPICQIDIDRLPIGRVSLGYANNVCSGSHFPPIKVARLNNGRYKILDGRHRYLAHMLNDKKYIKAKFSLKYYEEDKKICCTNHQKKNI
jgi:hypothetical protein